MPNRSRKAASRSKATKRTVATAHDAAASLEIEPPAPSTTLPGLGVNDPTTLIDTTMPPSSEPAIDQGIISQHTTNNTPAPTTTATDESVDPGSFPNADTAADFPAPTTATDESVDPGSFPNADAAANIPAPTTTATDESINPGSFPDADAAANDPGSLPNADAAVDFPAPTTATDESVDPGSFPNADAAADIPAPTTTATDESINPGSFPNADAAANDPGSLLNADAAASNPGSLPNNDAAANIPAPITTAINKSIDPGSLLDADAAANRSGPTTSDGVNFVPVSSSGSNDAAVTTEADCAYDLDEDLVIVSKSSVPNAFEQNPAPTSSMASSTSAKHSAKQLGEDDNVAQSADEKAADNARLAWIRQELGKMTKERRQYNAEAIALQMKLYPNNDEHLFAEGPEGLPGRPIMITDEPRVRYKKPTSFEKIHRMRISHIAKMSRLSDAIAAHFKPTIDADDSADYREGRGIQRKRGFNDFLSAELRDNSIANQLVGKLVSEVCEYRKKLKGE